MQLKKISKKEDITFENQEVFIVGLGYLSSNERAAYENYILKVMKASVGYNPDTASIFLFCGGQDISTNLYGQENIASHTPNVVRDGEEAYWYYYAQARQKKPICVGICRGAQLLHVLNGGTLWQHVDKHENQSHGCTVKMSNGDTFLATLNSFHHQAMIFPEVKLQGNKPTLLAYLSAAQATDRRTADKRQDHKTSAEIEAMWYKASNTLCYQPHPEWDVEGGDTDITFRILLKEYGKCADS